MGLLEPHHLTDEPQENDTPEEKAVLQDHQQLPEEVQEEVAEMVKLVKKTSTEVEEEKKHHQILSAGFDYTKSIEEQEKEIGNINNEALSFAVPWYQCHKMGVQKTCLSHIPHFKEIGNLKAN